MQIIANPQLASRPPLRTNRRRVETFLRLTLFLASTLLSSPFCFQAGAQLDAAMLAGRVVNSSGIGIPGARLTLIDVERNTRVTTLTTDTGLYAFPELAPGHYRVEVAASGFKGVRLANLYISTADAIQQNFRLAVGYGSEPATLEAKTTPLDMSAGVKTIIDPKLARELPLNGRSFQTLFQLAPGLVITPTDFSNPGQFSVNGQRTDANYITVDGVSANVGISAGTAPGQTFGGALPALSVIGSTNSLVAIGDVQEFVVQTSSYGAEFGRMPGAQIGIVTRSGTNEVHGELFEYLRNDLLDANDWFANHERLSRAALRQNDFGGVLGGPLIRDRTFFFVSYEALRLRQPTTGQSDVPTINVRRSAPAAMQPFFDAYPLPTGPDEGSMAPANYAFSNPLGLDAASVRVDHHFSSGVSIFARYSHSPSDVNGRANGDSTLNTITHTGASLDSITAGVKQPINQELNNDVRFNWTSSSAGSNFRVDNFGSAIPLDPRNIFPTPFRERDSALVVDLSLGSQNSALELGRNGANLQRQISVVDNVSWQTGKHVVNCGFDFRQLTPQFSPSVYSQVTVFRDFASAEVGSAATSIISAKVATKADYSNYSLYAQDTWRHWSRLVFSYGLRWEFNPAPSGGGSGMSPFAVTGLSELSTLALAPPGTRLYRAPRAQLAPRLGVAYQLRRYASTESVIRAGAGIFHDLNSAASGDAFANFPFIATKVLPGPVSFPLTTTEAAPPLIASVPPYSTIIAFPHALKQPYSYEWNVGLEQAIGKSQALTVTYLGSIGRSLIRTDEYIGGGLPTVFTEVAYVNNGGYSNYNALQAQFRRRANNGLDVVASYTLSHSLDDVSSGAMLTVPGRFLDPATDYASSDFDIRHSGEVAIDYDLPGPAKSRLARALVKGWSLDSIFIIRSSPTINVVDRDIGFGRYDFRPDVIPGEPIYLADPAAPGGLRINSNAFSVPVTPRQGNLGRNALRGFPLIQGDLALRRVFRLRDKLDFQARIEAFNVLNHPNFSPETGQLGVLDMNGKLIPQNGFGVSHAMLSHGLQQSSFGTGLSPLYQIGSSRSLQLSARFEF